MPQFPIKIPFAQDTTNKVVLTEEQQKEGIPFQADLASNLPNGYMNFTQSAIRDLQVRGGFYDNNQVYNKDDFVSVLINISGQVLIRTYHCKVNSTTKKPPIQGTQNTQDAKGEYVVVYGGTLTDINTNEWDRVAYEAVLQKGANVTVNKQYLICDNTAPYLDFRISIYSNDLSKNVCSFELIKNGDDFKISNCFYDASIKAKSGNTAFGSIFFAGFGLMKNTNGLHLAFNDTFNGKVTIDYSKTPQYTPPLSETPIDTPNGNTIKPYAIREGGGTHIQDLGIVKHSNRIPNSTANGESYEFYLFSNGYVKWTSSLTLDTKYYHQYSNSGFLATNIDVSDAVLHNTGADGGTGGLKAESLPNIKGSYECSAGTYGAYGNNQSIQSGDTITTTGAFGERKDSMFTNNRQIKFDFDANRNSSTYTNGGKVRAKSLVNTMVLQAF